MIHLPFCKHFIISSAWEEAGVHINTPSKLQQNMSRMYNIKCACPWSIPYEMKKISIFIHSSRKYSYIYDTALSFNYTYFIYRQLENDRHLSRNHQTCRQRNSRVTLAWYVPHLFNNPDAYLSSARKRSASFKDPPGVFTRKWSLRACICDSCSSTIHARFRRRDRRMLLTCVRAIRPAPNNPTL